MCGQKWVYISECHIAQGTRQVVVTHPRLTPHAASRLHPVTKGAHAASRALMGLLTPLGWSSELFHVRWAIFYFSKSLWSPVRSLSIMQKPGSQGRSPQKCWPHSGHVVICMQRRHQCQAQWPCELRNEGRVETQRIAGCPQMALHGEVPHRDAALCPNPLG